MNQDTLTRTCDTSDMFIPHGMLRQAFANDVIGAGSSADRKRAPLITSFYANVLAFLHAHHAAEDALLWPLLRARAPERAALLERMEAQHAAVDEVTLAASRALDAYSATPTEESARSLAAAIRRLAVELDAHLVEEERETSRSLRSPFPRTSGERSRDGRWVTSPATRCGWCSACSSSK